MSNKIEFRGRFKTCKICGYEFKIFGIENRMKWEENKYICPNCKGLYCDKPKTERDLMILQDNYLLSRSEEYLLEIIDILTSYTQSIIKKYFSKSIDKHNTLEIITHKTVSLLVEGYLSKENYKVWGSFKGMIVPKVKQALWEKKEHDIDADSLDFEFEDGTSVSYADCKKTEIESLQELDHKKDLANKLSYLTFKISDYCSSEYEDYIRLLNVMNYLEGGETYPELFFKMSNDRTGKLKYMQTLELIRKTLLQMEVENN